MRMGVRTGVGFGRRICDVIRDVLTRSPEGDLRSPVKVRLLAVQESFLGHVAWHRTARHFDLQPAPWATAVTRLKTDGAPSVHEEKDVAVSGHVGVGTAMPTLSPSHVRDARIAGPQWLGLGSEAEHRSRE